MLLTRRPTAARASASRPSQATGFQRTGHPPNIRRVFALWELGSTSVPSHDIVQAVQDMVDGPASTRSVLIAGQTDAWTNSPALESNLNALA